MNGRRQTASGVGTSAGVLAAGVFAACAGGGDGPASLRFVSDGPPRTYLATYEQAVEWGAAELERAYSARVTLPAEGAAADAAGLTPARLDSLGVAITLHGGRQAFDTRHLVGAGFGIRVPASGGSPTFSADAPALELGILEGRVTLDRLFDFAFPDLPDEAARVGDGWTVESTRPDVEGMLRGEARVTIDYELAGWETVDGVRCARILGRLTGDARAPTGDEAGGSHGGAGAGEFAGTIAGTLSWLVDPEAGALVRMSGELRSDGTLAVSGEESRIRQTTRIRIEQEDL